MKTYGEPLPGVEVITHTKFKDSRGDFCELWKSNSDKMRGTFRQINLASSTHNVLRGMHRQDQSKLVIPLVGEIFDVALDVESNKWFGVILDNTNALFIPPQYAHGYLVLSETSLVQYVVDMPYNKPLEENFRWDGYSIDWPYKSYPILSDKDA
jgi:dTDP-4-dehydrorhamnose 3,5-epimerase|tara:strand:+ start:1119 stop:1580 length:462 start_codon:yes stop_codon:yes gene_type:complete